MFICYYEDDKLAGTGPTLMDAYKDMPGGVWNEIGVNACKFYEIGEPIPVEMKLVKKEVIVNIKKRKK